MSGNKSEAIVRKLRPVINGDKLVLVGGREFDLNVIEDLLEWSETIRNSIDKVSLCSNQFASYALFNSDKINVEDSGFVFPNQEDLYWTNFLLEKLARLSWDKDLAK
nr:hypothetical protein [uncultured Draconibacterium sp.]